MNRRSFISRLAAVAVVCPALRWVPMPSALDYIDSRPLPVTFLNSAFVRAFAHHYVHGLHSQLAHLQTIGLEMPPTTLEEAARFVGEEDIYKACIE